VPARNSIQNQNKSNKHTNVNSAQTIRTANRFSLLSNLEVDSMILCGPYGVRIYNNLLFCIKQLSDDPRTFELEKLKKCFVYPVILFIGRIFPAPTQILK